MWNSKAMEWLAAYTQRICEIPALRPDLFVIRLMQSRSGSESALREICSASLRTVLDVARDICDSQPGRAVWDVVQDANSVILSAVKSFFGGELQEFESHLRTTVRLKVETE